jgi:murein DD-endopeptidase MepM/ murein hydrolase activator NlpD
VETYDKDKYELPIKDNDAEITSKFGKRTDPVT